MSLRLLSFIAVLSVIAHCFTPFTARDMNLLKRVGDPVVSPDKTRFAYTVNVWDEKANKKTTNLYISNLKDNEIIPVAPLQYVADSNPIWAYFSFLI